MPELPPFENTLNQSEVAPIGDVLPPPVDPAEQPEGSRLRGVRSLFAWIFRWALLGVGVGGVWILGVLVAQFFPSSSPQPPLQEVVTRRSNRFVQKVRRLPSWWRGDDFRPSGSAAIPRFASEPPAAPSTSRPITLSNIQREQITVEMEAIQTDLQQLRDRTSAVEQQLSLPNLAMPLEDRLGGVENRLSPPTETAQPPESAPAESAAPPANTVPPPDPLLQVDAYRVTLPSDVLFSPGDAILQPNSQPLLDSILQDIGQYPGATILVGSYSDIQMGEGTVTDLSYQQAIAIQRYLAQRLGNDTYHWVAVGYGNTSLGSTGSTQLSRRVTIAIVP